MHFSNPNILLFAASLLPSFAAAQLSGPVGPLTTREAKRSKVCSVLDYGGIADKKGDIGPALVKAFEACKTGGTVYVPPGDYGMSTWASLVGGSAWALQLDGIIYRVGSASGSMIFIENTTDFEMYSSTSKGAIQGYGYQVGHSGGGTRLLRLHSVTSFSVHDIALVDAPVFHLVIDTCHNGELYNMAVRGANIGGTDGIDVWGTNIHVHDVEVTNKDECVDIKSPASDILVENIHCNRSGGGAIGSLGPDSAVSNVVYRNIYTWQSNQMFMIKSSGGSGFLKNAKFSNFIGHSNAYSLNIDANWTGRAPVPGPGVELSSLHFENWKGTAADGTQRAPIKIVCPDKVPCKGISITDFAVWTDKGNTVQYKCKSAYGTGACLKPNGAGDYPLVVQNVQTPPAGNSPPKMPNDLPADFDTDREIPIPDIPTSFFPGTQAAVPLLGSGQRISDQRYTTQSTNSEKASPQKSTSQKATSQKTTSEKTTSEKTTSEKTTPEKTTPEKTTSKKPTSKKPTSKKPTSKKPTAEKATSPKPTSQKAPQKATSQKATTHKTSSRGRRAEFRA